ncbi:hypothetical protein BYT27DRAFT_7200161, partial [Phlegmacium glaucopus]
MEVGLGWHLVKLETTILPPIHGSNLRKRYHAALNVLRSISSAYGPIPAPLLNCADSSGA